MPDTDRGVDAIEYYDRQGNKIDVDQYTKLIIDPDYKRVAYTDMYDILVSTVWLGMNHSFHPEHPVLIFETMIFGNLNEDGDEYQERYTTEEEALAGHQRAVRIAFPMAVTDGHGEWFVSGLTT